MPTHAKDRLAHNLKAEHGLMFVQMRDALFVTFKRAFVVNDDADLVLSFVVVALHHQSLYINANTVVAVKQHIMCEHYNMLTKETIKIVVTHNSHYNALSYLQA